MPTDAVYRHYPLLSGPERLALLVDAMARGDRAEERRLGDTCPLVTYRAEDDAYRGRVRRLGVLALATALDLREGLVVLRAAAAFGGEHGRALCEASFGPLLHAAFLAGRGLGRWEAGAEPAAESVADLRRDPDLRQDLAEVAACAAEAAGGMAAAPLRGAAGELHAGDVLTRWAGRSAGSAGRHSGWTRCW